LRLAAAAALCAATPYLLVRFLGSTSREGEGIVIIAILLFFANLLASGFVALGVAIARHRRSAEDMPDDGR
jgi:predicted permease